MTIRKYAVTLKGISPLLMHWDNLEWADEMEQWRIDNANLGDQAVLSKAGDDRTPAFRWLGTVYHDGTNVSMPSDNIQRMSMEGGAMVLVGSGKKTYKAQSQSGMYPEEADWPLTVRGRTIPWAELEALKDVPHFGLHVARARELGFRLFVKRAKIGRSKHVRVRSRYDEWAIKGTYCVTDEKITRNILQQILDNGGLYKGLGDWRPGGPTPGRFGMFEARVEEV